MKYMCYCYSLLCNFSLCAIVIHNLIGGNMKEPVRKHEIHEIIMKIAVHKLLNRFKVEKEMAYDH